MAVITAKAVTGNFSVGTNWVGDVAPTTGDTVVIPSGATITVDTATPVLGSNASAVGHGVRIQATDGTTFGKLVVASGATLNLQGYDRVNNTAMLIDRYAMFEPQDGSTVLVDCATDWSTGIINNGHILASGATFDIPPSLINWDNAGSKSGGLTYCCDNNLEIQYFPIFNGTTIAPGPISNAGGSAIGSNLDSSFIVTSSSNGPISGQEKGSYDDLISSGDYYVDYKNAIVYYKRTNIGVDSVSYTFKYATWFGWGVTSAANTDDSTAVFENCVFNWMGGCTNQSSEYVGHAIYVQYKSSYSATRLCKINSNTFNFCTRPVQFYNIATNNDNWFVLDGNSFIGCRNQRVGGWVALFVPGYTNYYEIKDTYFDSFCAITYEARGGIHGALRGSTGRVSGEGVAATSQLPYFVEDNDLAFYGSMDGFSGIDRGGTAAGGFVYYRRNRFSNINRVTRLVSYMHLEDNFFQKTYHNSVVLSVVSGYTTNVVFKNNAFDNNYLDQGGGLALGGGAGGFTWLDSVDFENFTANDGIVTFNVTAYQPASVLATRTKVFNIIGSNSERGFRRPANTSDMFSSLQFTRFDYCNDYNNEQPSEMKPGSPMVGEVEYNLDVTRNIPGIALWNPSEVNATGKTLSLVVSGTPGTDLSMLLSWGGGTAVELVATQGTATGGTAATTHTTPGTLADTGKSWGTNAFVTNQGRIISGTGAGQEFMCRNNTATTITILARNTAGTWTAPSSDSVYVVLKSEVVLSDGTQSVNAGLHISDAQLTAGTYTDTGITFESHVYSVDPAYAPGTDLVPTNMSLATSGFGGTYIGAKEPQSADDTAPALTDPTATATGATTATATVTTDDGNGTLYFLASENSTESAATVKAALSQSVTAAGEQSISLSALGPETTYYVHFVQINGAGLESASVVTTSAITTPAIVYPAISATASASSTSAVSATVTTDTAGGTIYGVLSESVTEMEAADIKSGADDTATVTDAGDYTLNETSLATWAQYYWHIVHEDADGLMSNVLTIPVRTLDISIPLAFSDTAPATLLGVQVWSKMPKKADVEGLYGA